MADETERLFVERIRKLEKSMSNLQNNDVLNYQVAAQSEGLQELEARQEELERRVNRLENSRYLTRWIIIQLSATVLVVSLYFFIYYIIN